MDAVMRAIRGATTVDEDVAEQVTSRTTALLAELLAVNEIAHDDIVSMIFTCTADITAGVPATAARQLGLTDIAILGAIEAEIVGAPKRCIRVLVHCYSRKPRAELRPVYLEGARHMRADIANRAAT
jgi:chorismate mutase